MQRECNLKPCELGQVAQKAGDGRWGDVARLDGVAKGNGLYAPVEVGEGVELLVGPGKVRHGSERAGFQNSEVGGLNGVSGEAEDLQLRVVFEECDKWPLFVWVYGSREPVDTYIS